MRGILGLIVFLGLLWLGAFIGLQVVAIYDLDHQQQLRPIIDTMLSVGRELGTFIRPIVQLILIIFVLLAVAEHFNISIPRTAASFNLGTFSTMNNVQALIALIIVGAVCVAALGGLPQVGVLKDLALVVVGFYFGSRRRPHDETEALVVTVPQDAPPPTDESPTGSTAGPGESAGELRRTFDAS